MGSCISSSNDTSDRRLRLQITIARPEKHLLISPSLIEPENGVVIIQYCDRQSGENEQIYKVNCEFNNLHFAYLLIALDGSASHLIKLGQKKRMKDINIALKACTYNELEAEAQRLRNGSH